MVSGSSKKVIDSRLKIVSAVLALWLLAVLSMLFNVGVFNRESYIEKGNNIAVRQFFVHPQRGWILDRNREVLASSATYFDLTVEPSVLKSEERQRALYPALAEILPDFNSDFTNRDVDYKDGALPVKQDLSAEQAAAIKPLLEEFPELAIRPRTERIVYDDPAVRKLVGTVSNVDNILVGESGLELKYNETLSGTALIYEVTVDRFGKPIPATVKVLQEGKKGGDVVLPSSLEEIIAANPAE